MVWWSIRFESIVNYASLREVRKYIKKKWSGFDQNEKKNKIKNKNKSKPKKFWFFLTQLVSMSRDRGWKKSIFIIHLSLTSISKLSHWNWLTFFFRYQSLLHCFFILSLDRGTFVFLDVYRSEKSSNETSKELKALNLYSWFNFS